VTLRPLYSCATAVIRFLVLLRSICPLTVAVSSVCETPLENLIIHLQFVLNFELRSSEFLLVFFVSQAGISLRGEVNRLETRLITRGVVVLRLQDSVFRSEAGLVCRSPPKTIVTFYLTEDRESRPHQAMIHPAQVGLAEA
jgi:hypothetical protein